MEEKGGKVKLTRPKLFKKKRAIVFLLIFLFLFIALLIIYFYFPSKNVCGDGTFYDSCSERKPYFCEQGVLIEKASICGCSENLTLEVDSCFSEYQADSKNITLNYILRGEEGEILFTVYGGLSKYVSKLPRSISLGNGDIPSKEDFKLRRLDEKNQEVLLVPLIKKIQNMFETEKDQVRVAVSLVQKIPFGNSEKIVKVSGSEVDYARYPYEVLYDEEGVCGEKAELLAFILREMGYGVAFLYYPAENHEALAVKCPRRHSVAKTGYCFIETTGPAIMTDDSIEYVGVGELSSKPELIIISEGKSLGNWWYEFRDANVLMLARHLIEKDSLFASLMYNKVSKLNEKYGLREDYNI